MNRKEAIKKWEEIISEMETKKSELDNLLGASKQSSEQTSATLNDTKNKLNEVISIENQVNQKLQSINQSHSDISQKEGEIKNKSEAIAQAYSEIESKKVEIEKLRVETTEFYQVQKNKYNAIYKQIEDELKSGTTSLNLSKSFADKVKGYFRSGIVWSVLFIIVLGIAVAHSYFTISKEAGNVKTIDDVWRLLSFRAPLIAFVVWLVAFLGNRRAESKKLEESYKHKEVLARSFVGYRKTLEELGDQDKELLKQHMGNLLSAIKEDSGKFLNSEGERHPFLEAFFAYFSKNKKGVNNDEKK